MGERNFKTYTNGTSALKVQRWMESPDDAKIIAFPGSRAVVREGAAPALDEKAGAGRVRSFARKALDSSEMYCSLRYESFMGCPYNLFTEKGIAALSIGGAVIGIVSLILGA